VCALLRCSASPVQPRYYCSASRSACTDAAPYVVRVALSLSLPPPPPNRPSFVFKRAHMSREDYRIFDAVSGRPIAVMFHHGKNPYGALDPLQLGDYSQHYNGGVSRGAARR